MVDKIFDTIIKYQKFSDPEDLGHGGLHEAMINSSNVRIEFEDDMIVIKGLGLLTYAMREYVGKFEAYLK